MIPQTARKFSPIFVATSTPGSIEIKKSRDGADYLLCSGAKFDRPGQEAQTRTVMAFGRSAADVHKLLTTGKPVELDVQFNGGTIKVIGTPRERQAATSKPTTRAHSMPKQLLPDCIDAADFDPNERSHEAACPFQLQTFSSRLLRCAAYR